MYTNDDTRYALINNYDEWYIVPDELKGEARAYFAAAAAYDFGIGDDDTPAPTEPTWLEPLYGGPEEITFLSPA